MNNITDLINPDFSAKEHRLAKDMVDLGISFYNGLNRKRKEIGELYQMFHGKYSKEELTEMTTVHGEVSSTPLKPNHLAKVKINQLLNESLEVGFSVEVDTISPAEKQKKADEKMKAVGRSYAKPIIEKVREKGFQIYEGVEIPDFFKGINPEEFRTRNELVSQRIVNEKVKDFIRDNGYYYAFASNLFASEIFTFNRIGRDGKTIQEVIAPERMIYPMIQYDQFFETVPIIGHWTHMTFADIIRDFQVKKESPEYKKIEQIFQGTLSQSGVTVPLMDDGTYNFSGVYDGKSSQMTATVFYFQWRYYIDKITRKNTDGTIEYFAVDDKEIAEDVRLYPNKYATLRLERIYQGATVNNQVYIGFKDVDNYAVSRDANGNIRANYDYTCSLVKTFGGKRTSFARVLFDLNKQYDKARWMLFREISKNRSNSIYIDKDYAGKKSSSQILHDLEDNGYIEISSNAKFDETGERLTDGKQVIGTIASGTSSSMISELISFCMDIERVMDSVTGITPARKGTEKATTTATTSENNLQASRSQTYDNFYFTENHMQRGFTHLIQKTKSVIWAGSKEAYSYLSPDDVAYLESSPDYFRDNFQARIVGGRRSQQIFAELSAVVQGEVGAGKRSAADFALIKQSDSLREAIEILKNSDEKMQAFEQQMQQQNNEAKLQMNQNTTQASIEAREDEQAAAKELQDSINATQIQTTQMKIIGDLQKQRETPPSVPANKPTSKKK